ncbi:MAG: hypothetical protein QOJ65_151 [Fimbriimonadaceae bacterium]|jgi:aminoglycoside phosphotransferase (APT) family kinase protein|nr:hypothetical protein [Fimbriimonadaceae bacterium]
MPLWDADIPMDDELARRLVADQFRDLAGKTINHLASGWDNEAYLVDDRVVFRFPRRQVAVELIEREVRILPLLAPNLSLRVPAPTHVGRPSPEFPYPWAGYEILPGTTADRVPWTDDERSANAEALGHFLKELHSIPVDEQTRAWAPGDDIGRTDLAGRLPKLLERLDTAHRILPDLPLEKLRRLATDLAETEPWPNPPCWVHGDLYVRHLVVDGEKRVTGIIDWGDVHLGDPALDLSIAFTVLPLAAHAAFEAAYRPIDAATCRRADFRAINYGAILVEYGQAMDDSFLMQAGEFVLHGI